MIALIAFAAGAVGAAALTGGTVAPGDRAAIERIVHDYILSHPEILPEAMEKLRDKEVAKAVKANRTAIEAPFAGAWEGAADADVTVVEFFDYNCGYCRASLPVVEQLLREDKKLKIVYREFPVLGSDSENAARASLAAAKAGKYRDFHRALFAAGKTDAQSVARVAKGVGLDLAFAQGPEARTEVETNLNLARPLGLTGTPSWVVGQRVLSGAVGYDALKAAIAEARAR